MPQIPLSQEGYGFTPQPTPNPAAASEASDALSQGMARVNGAFSDLDAKLTQGRDLSEASTLSSQAAQNLADLRLKYDRDPDYATAGDRFKSDAQDLRNQLTQSASNPRVAQMVGEGFDRRAVVNYVDVARGARQQETLAQQANLNTSLGGFSTALSKSTNPVDAAMTVNSMKASIAGAQTAGWVNPLQAQSLLSNNLRQSVALTATTDPAAASRMLETLRPDLTPADQVALAEHLAPKLLQLKSAGIVNSVAGGAAGAGGDFADRVIGYESSGDPTAQNPRSSATGAGQFISGTWLPLIKSAMPDLAAGKSDADLLALRKDPTVSRQMVTAYANQNAPLLTGAGLDASPANLYLAHRLGPGDAIKVLKASGDAPLSSVLSDAVMTANPDLRGKSASDLTQTANARMGGVGSGMPGLHPPDLQAWQDQAREQAGGDPILEQRAVAGVTARYHQWMSSTQVQRTALLKTLPDVQAALADGRDAEIPEQQLRALLPADKVEPILDQLHEAQADGQVMTQVRSASPADLATMRAQLADGVGPIDAVTKPQRGRAGAIAATTTPEPVPGETDPGAAVQGYRQKRIALERFDKAVVTRNTAIAADPAAFAMHSDAVSQARQAIDPNNPQTTATYVQASLAEQVRLGVPEAQQLSLTKPELQGFAQKIMTTDPAKGDVGGMLDQAATTYGAAWPKVYQDLVTVGKLPAEYQMLAAMPDPVARTQFQRALAVANEKGGVDKLREAVNPDASKYIGQNLDAQIDGFRRTASVPGINLNLDLIDHVRSGIKLQAYANALGGMDGQTALDQAGRAFLGRYDFDGTMRVPKGMLGQVQQATSAIQAGLKPEDLAPMASGDALTPDERLTVTQRAAQRGFWMPNEADDGLVLASKLRDGSNVLMRRRDGSRIELKFGAMPVAAAAAADPPIPAAMQTPVMP